MVNIQEISARIIKSVALINTEFAVLVIPVVIIAAIALMAFARHSFKLFKVVLPFAGIVAGYVAGSHFIGDLLAKYAPAVGEHIDPYLLAGLVVAAAAAFFCIKFPIVSIFLIGGTAGYILIGRLAKDILLAIPFVHAIATSVERPKSMAVGIIISVVCMIVTAFIVKKYFKTIYIMATSIGCSMLALGGAAIFLFESTSFTTYATIVALSIGAIIGLIFCYNQLDEHAFD